MALILDTSFVIRFLRGDEPIVRRFAEMKRTGAPMLIPAPAYYEIRIGYELLGSPEEFERFREKVSAMQVPPFDRSRAAIAARQQARLRDAGRESGPVDAMVLSFVSSGSDTLVARDGPLEDAARSLGIQVDPHPASADT